MALPQEQLAPHSIECEEAVIGSILVNPNSIDEVLPFLQTDDFFLVRLGWIWDAMVAMAARRDHIDYLTVSTELKQRGKLEEVGGNKYLLDLVMRTPSSLNIEGYGRVVERLAVRRRLIGAASMVARIAHSDETDIEQVVNGANDAMASAIDRHVGTVSRSRMMSDIVADVQIDACQWRDDPRDVRGVACGFYPFDIVTGGFENGLLYLIAARPGIGKSALIAEVIRGIAETGVRVVLISLEMTDKAMTKRMGIQSSRVDATLLKQGRLPANDFDRFMTEMDRISQLPILIESRSGLSVLDMQAVVRRHEREYGKVGLVVIDTLDRVREDAPTYERMTKISHSVADWAHNSDMALLAAKQLSRANQKMQNKRPTLDALRDSGAVEEDADWVGGLHREYAFCNTEEERQQLRNEGKDHLAELIALKCRDGDADVTSEMYWNAPSLCFERLDKRSVDLWAITGSSYASHTVGGGR